MIKINGKEYHGDWKLATQENGEWALFCYFPTASPLTKAKERHKFNLSFGKYKGTAMLVEKTEHELEFYSTSMLFEEV